MKTLSKLEKYQIEELFIRKITGGDILKNLVNNEDEGDME